MSVKHQKIKVPAKTVEDDISLPEEIKMSEEKKEDTLDEKKLAELKGKLAKKKGEKEMPPKIVEKKRRSLTLAAIGTGQAGSRLAEEWYKLGYPAICMNTTSQDLEYIELPEDNKLLLEYSIGGSAKDPSIGYEAARANVNAINAMVQQKLEDAQIFILFTSLGGGSGSGSLPVLLDVLTAIGKPIVVICVLPLSSDDSLTKSNALDSLSKLSKLVKSKQVCNLIVVDNAKIEVIYNSINQLDFFKISNEAIVETLDIFNVMSTKPSFTKALDSLEFARLLSDGEGLSTYGQTIVPNYAESELAIAEAVINNLESGLLASGFDLKTAKYAGILMIANSKVWAKIPNSSVNYAMSLVKEMSSGAVEGTFKGIYVDDDIKDDIMKIFSFFSGMGLPGSRVKQLQKDAESEVEKNKQRAETRSINLTLEPTVNETMSEAEKVRDMIKKKSSTFGKAFGSGTEINDMRKKK